jgi:serine/threonine protein kinase/Flp pilus assembly protein TadD
VTTWNPQANDLFLAALDRPVGTERDRYLDAVCAGDPGLRAEVESLLAAASRAGEFLEAPAMEVTADLPLVGERTGASVGPYKLLQPLGEGGMGTVWMAEQSEPVRRKVAVKLIKAGMDSKQVLGRFEAERQALALMDHPNIAKVFDAGTTEAGRPFFVMELVKGVPITKFCDERRLTPRERLGLFVPVCQAVQHAHQKGVIHRDIKPSNVLVALYDGRPVPKVIDFGVAKAIGQDLTGRTLFTEIGQVIGTFEYMSPEQAELNQLDVDTRSDVYALGVLLYELLTGSTPLERRRLKAAAVAEVLRLIREEDPPRPSTRLSESKDALPSISAQRQTEPSRLARLVRGDLDWITMKALEKDRSRRYETATGLAHDIERYLADEPILARPPSAAYRVRKFVRRNRRGLAVGGFAALCLALLAGGAAWAIRDRTIRNHEQRQRDDALDREVSRLLEEADELGRRGRWADGLAAAERAEKLLAAAGRSDRPARLLDLTAELTAAYRLEEIGREPQAGTATAEEQFFWGREQDGRFAAAFRDLGIDVDTVEPAAAADRIERARIGPALVRALDQWAGLRRHAVALRADEMARHRLGDVPPPDWKRLVEVARLSDPDPWRARFRVALLAGDRAALERTADTVRVQDVPPATLHLLGVALNDLRAPDKAMDVLRRAQAEYPDDLWLNNALGQFSLNAFRPPRAADALRFYAIASALRPRSPRGHRAMASAYRATGAKDAAVAECTRAIELAPEDARNWYFRGAQYGMDKQFDKALDDYTRAVEIEPTNAVAHNARGHALGQLGRLDDAIVEYEEAIRLQPDWSSIYFGLRPALDRCRADGRLGGVIDRYRERIRLRPDDAASYIVLALALLSNRQPEEAVNEYRAADRLRPDCSMVRQHLCIALMEAGRVDEAIAELQADLTRRPADVGVRPVLAAALRQAGSLDKAISEYRQLLRVNPDSDVYLELLAGTLMEAGQWAEAATTIRRAGEVAKRIGLWVSPNIEKGIREAERMGRLDARVPAVLAGTDKPADAAELVSFAQLCQMPHRRLYAGSVRLYSQAFVGNPQLEAENRYGVACAAAMVAAGKGKDVDTIDDKDRARLRRQALDWLRLDLTALGGIVDQEPGTAVEALRHWLADPDLAAVRGKEALDKLPEPERKGWQELWDDAAAMLKRAAETPEKKKPGPK